LLFKEGDPFNPTKLEETERNLRQFDFLKTVSVTAAPPHDGLVDVAVVTQDLFTTDVNGDFSNDGGIAAYDFDVTQKDLFGTGSELALHLDHGVERRSNTIEFLHPAVLGPYWNLDALLSKNSDGNEEKLTLDRPLYSYSTPWTMSFLFDHNLRNARYFREGQVASRFRQEHREWLLERSRVLHAGPIGSSRLIFGVDLLDDSFDPLPSRPLDLIPNSRHFRVLEGGYESNGFNYIKLDYIDRDLREQDINLGRQTSVRFGVSPRLSSTRPGFVVFRGSESAGFQLSDRSFLLGRIDASTRAPHDRNTIVSAEGRFVSRFRTRYPQTLTSRIRVDSGWQLDRDVQFLGDGQNGLRAYPDFAFEGRKRLLLNVEHRVFLGREILQMFGPGIALFADSGQAVDRNFRLAGMKTDI
ncbi:MAG TPA: hypothetical protein VN971_05285, partial [Thermoanaerobaculia bacterium]|nr:hypothetical protein [Thermoanaerobaculia bacterium]